MENVLEYRGMSVEVWNDNDAPNPFEDWDCELPLMFKHDGIIDYSKGGIVEYLGNLITDGQIIRHQQKLAELLEIDLDYFIEQEFSKEDKAGDIRYELERTVDFEVLEFLCEITKTPYLNSESRGYSQGDYAEVFICYTDKFEEVTGCTKKQVDEVQLQATLNLFSAWVWGDVYGFTIDNGDDVLETVGGYYGSDVEKSGLMEEVRSVIDNHLDN
jgi:hypothetical protein